MAYEVHPGQGTLNANKAPNRSAKSPSYKGYLVLPDGTTIGLALWKVETQNGYLLSLKVDDREGEYWAKRLGRRQTMGVDAQRQDERNDGRGSAQRSRHSEERSTHSDDLDDEIPF